ncbi:MAG TPA: aldo/keto reductase [Streptosporangiaceae bacterium]|nr:aldo/keto reductase [Streptosporangiaceae bacterium]
MMTVPTTTLGSRGPLVSRIGLGLAALGRPAYITAGRGGDLPNRSVDGLRDQSFLVLDCAYAAGVRYVDAARSYGRAEEFLGQWLAARDHPDVVVGSKWGYRYVGDWQLDADQHEVKEHSLAMFSTQLAESRARLGDRIALYQVHSATLDSGVFEDQELLAALAQLRADGVLVGLTTSGPAQADTLRHALTVTVDGQPVFGAAQVTWNLLEPSVGPAAAEAADAGWPVLVKEAVANGRLVPGQAPPALTELAASQGVTEDAVALAAVLANPWATVVLSGAVTPGQLQSNLDALVVGALSEPTLSELDLAEPPEEYWAARSARPWG